MIRGLGHVNFLYDRCFNSVVFQQTVSKGLTILKAQKEK